MGRYIARRLLQAIPLLLIITVILFVLMENIGDPLATMGGRRPTRSAYRERLTRQLGLDKPIYVRYIYWLAGNDWTKIDMDGDGVAETPGKRKGVLRGDFGISLKSKEPVLRLIGERLPNTLLLMAAFEVLVVSGAIVVGTYSAVRQYSILDHIITGLSFVMYSMPIFFIALMSMYIFGVYFKMWGLPYLPTVGMFEPEAGKTVPQVTWHIILPVMSLALISLAGYSRFMRSSMLEVLGQDYMRTAKAKGLGRRYVLFTHGLKNAALPIVTIVGLDLPILLGGALVTERIFGWPGMGRLFFDSVSDADTSTVMAILVLISVAVIVFQIITDITYAWLDPRIRYD
jgi:peptide/nickel transport system permease protein